MFIAKRQSKRILHQYFNHTNMDSDLLSSVVQEGLKNLNAVINPEMTKKLISNAVKMALHPSKYIGPWFQFRKHFYIRFTDVPGNPEIYATKPDYAKQSEYAVLTLMIVAIKYGWDAQRVRSVLEELHVPGPAIDEIVGSFDKHQADLSVQNLTTGNSLPHLTNVEWKLTCDIRSSQSDATGGELNYMISLGRFRDGTGELESIADFQCNVEELQALVGKLKDIERHCEKLATNN